MSDRICTNCNGETASGCHLCNPFAIPTGIVAECLDCKAKDKRIEELKAWKKTVQSLKPTYSLEESMDWQDRAEVAEQRLEAVEKIPAKLRDDFSRGGMPTGAQEAIWYIEEALEKGDGG